MIGLDEYNDAIYYKLLDQLIGKVSAPLNEPENTVHPCWTDLFDSQAAFDEAVMNLTQWYNRASDKIRIAHQYDMEARIRFTGNISHVAYDMIFSVGLTLRLTNKRNDISKLIEEALDKLDADGKICSELNCICNKQYQKCPQINFIL